jgi:hypothetical protein
MPPFVILCEGTKIENLDGGKSISASSRVYWSSRGFAFERTGRHVIEVQVKWSIAGVPFGVRGRTDVWVNYPLTTTDNNVAATLMHPEVGMYVALGGGANHLTDAVDRLSRMFANGGGTGDSADGGGTPSALRGYDGLLKDLPSGGGGTSDKAAKKPSKGKTK